MTLHPEQINIGFNIVSDRLQMSHDLGCSLEKSETDWRLSEFLSDKILGTATLERVSFALDITCELMAALPL